MSRREYIQLKNKYDPLKVVTKREIPYRMMYSHAMPSESSRTFVPTVLTGWAVSKVNISTMRKETDLSERKSTTNAACETRARSSGRQVKLIESRLVGIYIYRNAFKNSIGKGLLLI